MNKPTVKVGRCKQCRLRFKQVGRGNVRMFCKPACRAKFYYRQNPEKAKARMRARYRRNPGKFKKYRKNYYNDVQKKPLVHRDRIVTWKVVELPRVPVRFTNFSGSFDDPYGMLADYELRHLLADFENEEGELCLEPKQNVGGQTNRDLPRPSPDYVPVNFDGGRGLPGYSDSRV